MVRKKILSRAKKNNFKGKAKGRRVLSKRVSKRVSKKRSKRSSNKKMRGGSGRRTTVMEPSEIEMWLNIGRDLGYNIPITKAEPAPAVEPAAVAEPAPAVEPAAVAARPRWQEAWADAQKARNKPSGSGPAAVAEPAPAVEPAAVAEPVVEPESEPESLELKLSLKLSLKSLESARRRLALAKLSERYDIPHDLLISINHHHSSAPAAQPKVNETEYKEIMKDIKLIPYSRSKEYSWKMVYNKNNIFILIFIDEKTKMIKIETMKARLDESIPRAPKGIATRVLYHMIREGGSGTGLRPGYTINVTAVTDESNIESLCRYYENMSFKKDPTDYPREGGSQRLNTSIREFLNNRIDDILIELIEIMVSNGILIQNATQLINTLQWRDIMRDDRDETIYNLLRELKEDIDNDAPYISGILSPDDKTKMEDIFSLYLSEV
jgi:hypothetical protein